MSAIKRFCVFLVGGFIFGAGSSLAGEDAATKVQEGNVQQWLEYYERERNQARDNGSEETEDPQATKSDAAGEKEGAGAQQPEAVAPPAR
ncbi:MAG: hypothetical protein PVH05_13655 [Burkholderiales bacterium]|jgi:hypothetical protein